MSCEKVLPLKWAMPENQRCRIDRSVRAADPLAAAPFEHASGFNYVLMANKKCSVFPPNFTLCDVIDQ